MKSSIILITLSLITIFSISLQADEDPSIHLTLDSLVNKKPPTNNLIQKEKNETDSTGSVQTSKPGSPWFPAPPDDLTPPASAE